MSLRSHEALWRFGIASELVLLICAITLAVILFVLLRPVGEDLARLAIYFNLVSIAVEATIALGLEHGQLGPELRRVLTSYL